MTDHLDLLSRTPADSEIRCSTQTREYPTTGRAAVAPGE
jgi:hypothetical protein